MARKTKRSMDLFEKQLHVLLSPSDVALAWVKAVSSARDSGLITEKALEVIYNSSADIVASLMARKKAEKEGPEGLSNLLRDLTKSDKDLH